MAQRLLWASLQADKLDNSTSLQLDKLDTLTIPLRDAYIDRREIASRQNPGVILSTNPAGPPRPPTHCFARVSSRAPTNRAVCDHAAGTDRLTGWPRRGNPPVILPASALVPRRASPTPQPAPAVHVQHDARARDRPRTRSFARGLSERKRADCCLGAIRGGPPWPTPPTPAGRQEVIRAVASPGHWSAAATFAIDPAASVLRFPRLLGVSRPPSSNSWKNRGLVFHMAPALRPRVPSASRLGRRRHGGARRGPAARRRRPTATVPQLAVTSGNRLSACWHSPPPISSLTTACARRARHRPSPRPLPAPPESLDTLLSSEELFPQADRAFDRWYMDWIATSVSRSTRAGVLRADLCSARGCVNCLMSCPTGGLTAHQRSWRAWSVCDFEFTALARTVSGLLQRSGEPVFDASGPSPATGAPA